MWTLTDTHSHILPALDDGSASVEQSLAMLRMEREQGVRRVIATPHFYAQRDSLEDFLAARAAAEQRLRAAAREPGLPELFVGAEVYFFRGMAESELLPRLTIQGGRCILIEMPPAPWPEEYYRELAAVRRRGLVPIVAHIDRYLSPLRTYGIPQRLAELPVLVQANAEFFLQRRTAGLALRLLAADRIQLLGSDCHDPTVRPPRLGLAVRRIERKLGTAALERLLTYEQLLTDAPPVHRMD